MATQLRALYKRRKGRDLFDIWYVTTNELIKLNQVFEIFAKYCTYNVMKISREEFIKNLEQQKDNRDFYLDMIVLLRSKFHTSKAGSFDLLYRMPCYPKISSFNDPIYRSFVLKINMSEFIL